MAALDCVINNTVLSYDEENYEIGRKSIRLTFEDNRTWDFFENGNWFQRGSVSGQGTWVCDGDRDYKITNTLGEVYSSKPRVWLSSPKSDPKFYCVANAAYYSMTFKNQKKLRGQNSLSIIFSNKTWVFNADKTFLNNTSSSGTWKCLGNNTFEIISQGFKWLDNGQGWNAIDEIDETFSCVATYFTDNKKQFTFNSDRLVRVFGTPSTTRYFYKNMQFVDMKTVNGKPVKDDSGTWECDGEKNWKLKSAKKGVYSSVTEKWSKTDVAPATPATTEPVADDSFPLKVGKRGPNVVKLQKFLNDKIPNNPLTVNGVFDEKTKDKLIEYQKKEGIIE